MAEIIKLEFDGSARSQKQIKKVEAILDAGGVVAYPTDTQYGLGVNPFNEEAVLYLYNIKNRPLDKPFIVLANAVEGLGCLISDFTSDAKILMDAFWPGPLTILCRVLPHLPAKLTAYTGKIGVRIPGNKFTRQFLEVLKQPLTATSANISGEKDLTSAIEVDSVLGSQVSAIIDGGGSQRGLPSTIIDATVSPPVILREGAISREQIEPVVGKLAC